MELISNNAFSVERPHNSASVAGPIFDADGGISTVVVPDKILPQLWMPTQEQITIGHSSLMLETAGPQLPTQSLLWALFDSYPSIRHLGADMSRLLNGLNADQARDLKECMTEICKVLPYGELPVVGGEVTERPAPMNRVETLKILGARAGLRHVYVLPGNLVDFALSCTSVQVTPTHEGMLLRFGDRRVEVPPASQMTQSHLLELVRFVRVFCPTLIVFSGVMEQMVRFAYLVFGYSYKHGHPVCLSLEQAVQRCDKLCPELLKGAAFLPSVESFAKLFRDKFMAHKAMCEMAEPHVMAAVTMVDDKDLDELFRRLCDVQKDLPDPFLGLLALSKMPRYDSESLIADAASSANRTAVNPLFDPVSQGAFGARLGRVMELTSVVHQLNVSDVSEVAIATGANGHKTIQISELPVKVKQLYAANYGHPDVVKAITALACKESTVIVDRGMAGDPRYQVSSIGELGSVQGLYVEFAEALLQGTAEKVAMCGPLSLWKGIPDWLARLGSRYDITLSRVGMDCTPFVWALGNRTRTGTGSADLKEKIQGAYDDLYIRVVLRKSLMMRGQPCVSLEANPMRLRKQPMYLVQFTGVPNLDANNPVAKRVHGTVSGCTQLYKTWKQLLVRATAPHVSVAVQYF